MTTPPAPKRTVHWMVRMNHRNRTWCFVMLFAVIGTHLAGGAYPGWVWGALTLQFLVYPQLLYLWARRASDPVRTEIRGLLLDTVLFGIWTAALAFPNWITFIMFIGVTVNMTAFRGYKGLALALVVMAGGAAVVVALTGLRVATETSMFTSSLSMLCISLFVWIVAEGAYTRAIKLHDMREQLRQSEAALKQQLHEIHGLQAQLSEQANRDALTGLHNRRYLDTTLARELARCEREALPLSLMLIDIDHFKRVNDTHGHQAGDVVLKTLASLLADQARAGDVCCRFGGEEFLLLLPGMGADHARERAERWRQAFAATAVEFKGQAIQTTLSVGVATYPAHGRSPDVLIRCADVALYAAKWQGRNQVMVATVDSGSASA